MTDCLLQLSGVEKAFGSQRVLDGVDLSLPEGSVTGLLGKNGAGKSTLIKTALGLIRPDAGEITILGEPAWTLSAEGKARLGYVPQSPRRVGWMNVGQLISYTKSFYPHWNDERVARLQRDFELDPKAKATRLSEGQSQKLAILLALGHEPDLLVLDEPASSLDPIARREFLRTVLSLHAEKPRSVLFSTHITTDLERVADRVSILKDGKICFQNELDALKDNVQRLRVSGKPIPEGFVIPGEIRRERLDDGALVVVGSDIESAAARLRELGAAVQIQPLGLDDIFRELHS